MPKSIKSIFISPDKGLPMQQVEQIEAIAGHGLRGDRYAEGRGAWSASKDAKIRHVSLIGAEAIELANQRLAVSFDESETRRNIVTLGVDLNNLINEEFQIGEVVLRGTELCDPCARPGRLVGRPDFMKAFTLLGGLRAEILHGGMIAEGQAIETQR